MDSWYFGISCGLVFLEPPVPPDQDSQDYRRVPHQAGDLCPCHRGVRMDPRGNGANVTNTSSTVAEGPAFRGSLCSGYVMSKEIFPQSSHFRSL